MRKIKVCFPIESNSIRPENKADLLSALALRGFSRKATHVDEFLSDILDNVEAGASGAYPYIPATGPTMESDGGDPPEPGGLDDLWVSVYGIDITEILTDSALENAEFVVFEAYTEKEER